MKYLNLNQKLYLEQIVCFCTRLIEMNQRNNIKQPTRSIYNILRSLWKILENI